ncbi:MAG TPA: gas vesicle protein GvpO [Spirochaetia bacterium]|nr:gas vesicle protein GvpO [Spirochaetia bacterium]
MLMKVIQVVQRFFSETLDRSGRIIGVSPDSDIWKVKIEVPEEVEYMRKKALDDLMAIYEVFVDSKLQIVSFERVALRERDSLTSYPVNEDTGDN